MNLIFYSLLWKKCLLCKIFCHFLTHFKKRSPEIFSDTNTPKDIESWFNLFKKLNEEELNIANHGLFSNLDLTSVKYNPNSPDSLKIGKLLLGAAIKGSQKEAYIQKIMQLDSTTQKYLMNIIQNELISYQPSIESSYGKFVEKKVSGSQEETIDVNNFGDLDRQLLEFEVRGKFQKQLEVLREEKRRSLQTIEDLNRQLKQRDASVLSLREENEKLQKVKEELLGALKDEEEKTSRLNQKLSQFSHVSPHLSSSGSSFPSSLSPPENNGNSLESSQSASLISRLKQKNEELLKQLEEQQESLIRKENALSQSESKCKALLLQSQKLRQLEDENDLLHEQLSSHKSLESKVSQMEKQLSLIPRQESLIASLTEKLEMLTNHNQSLKQQLLHKDNDHSSSFELQQKNLELQGKLQRALNLVELLQQEKHQLQSQYDTLQLDYTSLSRKNKALSLQLSKNSSLSPSPSPSLVDQLSSSSLSQLSASPSLSLQAELREREEEVLSL